VWGSASLNDATSVRRNTATNRGGGIYNLDTVSLSGASSVNHNTATSGGGVSSLGTFILRNASSITDNSVRNGGGLAASGRIDLGGTSSISHNSATNGGGIDNRGVVSLKDSSSVRRNTATITGGGVYNDSGSITVSDADTTSDNSPDNWYPPGTIAGCTNERVTIRPPAPDRIARSSLEVGGRATLAPSRPTDRFGRPAPGDVDTGHATSGRRLAAGLSRRRASSTG
jgi:predicted outer membrane repeat protein